MSFEIFLKIDRADVKEKFEGTPSLERMSILC